MHIFVPNNCPCLVMWIPWHVGLWTRNACNWMEIVHSPDVGPPRQSDIHIRVHWRRYSEKHHISPHADILTVFRAVFALIEFVAAFGEAKSGTTSTDSIITVSNVCALHTETLANLMRCPNNVTQTANNSTQPASPGVETFSQIWKRCAIGMFAVVSMSFVEYVHLFRCLGKCVFVHRKAMCISWCVRCSVWELVRQMWRTD